MTKPPFRELIPVCICGHGKVHHNGKFAECTCDVGHYKNEKLCHCPNFKLNTNDFRNKRIMETNESLIKQ